MKKASMTDWLADGMINYVTFSAHFQSKQAETCHLLGSLVYLWQHFLPHSDTKIVRGVNKTRLSTSVGQVYKSSLFFHARRSVCRYAGRSLYPASNLS